jgi:hypothetical protein
LNRYNMVEIRPEAAGEFCEHAPGLLKWLLKRVAPKRETDNNKLYAAEVGGLYTFESS